MGSGGVIDIGLLWKDRPSPCPAYGEDQAAMAELGEAPGLLLGKAICFSPSRPGPALGAARDP